MFGSLPGAVQDSTQHGGMGTLINPDPVGPIYPQPIHQQLPDRYILPLQVRSLDDGSFFTVRHTGRPNTQAHNWLAGSFQEVLYTAGHASDHAFHSLLREGRLD